ncbi:MAG: serine/threonine-protein kinase, partial [Phycisphaerales bacterium JB059]
MTAQGERVEALFFQAADLPPDERARFLRRACAGDSGLQGEVESLLAVDASMPEGYLQPPVPLEHPPEPGPAPGEVIAGRYRVLDELGEGGMGVVCRAEQFTPVRRLVAVKILKPGLDTRRVVRRFEMERQALAMMDHPGIARVLDAGVTPEGRPFFVMDLIRGEDLKAYCRSFSPDLRTRLELFARVCDAVQHAHTKGVIHRDLKPSNILVKTSETGPSPAIIDFGIAKAIGGAGGGDTLDTREGQQIGTLEYMSPEQASGDPDIDTRSDIYALGSVLFELLTGRSATACAERSARTPERPSRVRRFAEDAPRAPVEGPPVTPARLRGELDWIVLKAMDPDRERRYETAESLAADMRRSLRNEPLEAGPPSVRYRVGKFAARNRGLMLSLTLVLLTLLTATGISAVMAVRENQARTLAERNARQAAAAGQRAERVNLFLQSMLLSAQETGRSADRLTLRDIMLETGRRLDEGALAGQPDVEYEVRTIIGRTLLGLGWQELAVDHLAWVSRYAKAAFGQTDRRALNDWARYVEAVKETGDLETALAEFRALHEVALRVYGDRDVFTLRAFDQIGNTLMRMGRPAEAIEIHLQSLEVMREVYPPDDPILGLVTFNLAGAYRNQRDFERAEPVYREAIHILGMAGTPEAEAAALRARRELGSFVLPALGRVDEGRALLLDTLERAQRTLGPTHGMTANAVDSISHFCWRHGPLEEALRWSDLHLELISHLYHPGDWRQIGNAQRRTGLLLALGRYDEAADAGEELLRQIEASQEPELLMAADWGMNRAAWMGVWVRAAIAQAHLNAGRAQEAKRAARRLVEACDRSSLSQ